MFVSLHQAQYLSLTTFRRDGRAVSSPVWFAAVDERLYLMSLSTAGKLKRIRNDASVLVAPCRAAGEETGERLPGLARILSGSEIEIAARALRRKYRLQHTLVFHLNQLQGGRWVFVEIRDRTPSQAP